MATRTLFPALLAAAILCAGGAHAAEPVVKENAPDRIPLYLSDTRVLVMLRIGEAPPMPVMFDTGTNGNLVDMAVAKVYKLPNTGPSPSIDGSTGLPVPGHDSFIANARLGGVPIKDARASVLDYQQQDEAGIFGPNSFPGRLLEMDGPRSVLLSYPMNPATLPSQPASPYLGEGGGGVACGGPAVRRADPARHPGYGQRFPHHPAHRVQGSPGAGRAAHAGGLRGIGRRQATDPRGPAEG